MTRPRTPAELQALFDLNMQSFVPPTDEERHLAGRAICKRFPAIADHTPLLLMLGIIEIPSEEPKRYCCPECLVSTTEEFKVRCRDCQNAVRRERYKRNKEENR